MANVNLQTQPVALAGAVEALFAAIAGFCMVMGWGDTTFWGALQLVFAALIGVVAAFVRTKVWSQASLDQLATELEVSDPDEGPPAEYLP